MNKQVWALFVLHDGEIEWTQSSKLYSRRRNAEKQVPSWFNFDVNEQVWTYPGVFYRYKLMYTDLMWKDAN